jgi:hypothetical protein
MKRLFGIVAAIAAFESRLMTGAGANAARAVTATTCTAGTWTQSSADVTSAMGSGALNAVTVVSATDARAVGWYYISSTNYGSLWESWTGGSTWKVVGTIWAAGYYGTADTGILVQKNGVTSLQVADADYLNGIATGASRLVIAVGATLLFPSPGAQPVVFIRC